MEKEIKIRAHHILCMSLFEGKGYDEFFTRNISDIIKNLHNYKIEIVKGSDDICKFCPNSVNGECVLGEEDVHKKDENAMNSLGINYGEIKVNDINKKLGNLTKDSFNLCCNTCRWHKTGICSFEKIKIL
jgi:hypothetical protein